jgi:hypothetical protein
MKKSLRLALLVCAGFAGLTLAGPALAAYEPSLTIEQSSYKLGAPFTADLFLAASQNDDPSAKLTLSAPAGYGVNLNKAPGTKVGSAIAIAQVAALGGAPVPLTGDVVVGNPADPSLAAASTRCTGSPANQAVLVLNLAIEGQPPTPFPVFANKVGPLATFQVCAPYPEISSSNPSGARILLLDATIRGIFTNATSAKGYEWTTLFTPYNTATKAPNPAGTIEWRTYVGLPSKLTLVKAKTKKGVKLVGKLSIAGVSPQGVRLALYAGKKRNPAPTATTAPSGKRVVRSGKLPRSGKYTIKRPAVKFTTFFQTRFENYVTECTGPSPSGQVAPGGCRGEDLAAITSNQVKATKPKKKRRG